MSIPEKSFTAILDRFNSNLWHFHVMVPIKIAELYIQADDKRVVCTINKTITFQAGLMPINNGEYFINVNKKIRDKLKINEGDEILISIEKDKSKYGLPLPSEFEELLHQDTDGSKLFHQLTPGKQRTLLFIIAKPKAPDLRIRNGIAILEHLKKNNNQINFKQLNDDIKNTF